MVHLRKGVGEENLVQMVLSKTTMVSQRPLVEFMVARECLLGDPAKATVTNAVFLISSQGQVAMLVVGESAVTVHTS
jgi:hypothetical protein